MVRFEHRNYARCLDGIRCKNKKWIFTKSGSPKSSGTLKALYRHGDVGTGTANANEITLTTTCTYDYKTIGEEKHLHCDLKDWQYLSEIRVVLNLEGNASDYALICDQFYPITGFSVGSSNVAATKGDKGAAVQGVSVSSGVVAFVFATCDKYNQNATYNFKLAQSSKIGTIQKSEKLDKITNCNKIKSIKLIGTWSWTNLTGGSGNKSWTQLWEGGPKFANFNVGSTITSYQNQTEYTTATVGGLYAWHAARNARTNKWNYTSTYNSMTKYDDTATHIWGSSWREPTSAELQSLIDNCTWTFCDGSNTQYASGCTLKGFKVSGKGLYDACNIFLPSAGQWDTVTDFFEGETGQYWSSEPAAYNVNYYSTTLYFWNDRPSIGNGYKSYGQSIRAVLK